MKSKRPIDLPLSQVIKVNSKSPIAIASILHRISGIIIFLLIPLLLWVSQASLASQESFDELAACFADSVLLALFTWAVVAALLYHFVMGVKHMLADLGWFEETDSGRLAAWISLAIAAVLIVWSFFWIVV